MKLIIDQQEWDRSFSKLTLAFASSIINSIEELARQNGTTAETSEVYQDLKSRFYKLSQDKN